MTLNVAQKHLIIMLFAEIVKLDNTLKAALNMIKIVLNVLAVIVQNVM